MASAPKTTWVDRKWIVAGVCGALLLVGWCGWRIFQSPEIRGKSEADRASSSAISHAFSASSHSRMIEADPSETRLLAAKDNAATDWRQEFALAEKLTQREKEILKEKPPANPAAKDEEIAALLARIDPIILLLRHGAAKPGCDWGVHNFTFATKMPQINMIIQLSKIALWDARQRVANEPGEARQNLQVLDRLGNTSQLVLVDGMINATVHRGIYDFIGRQGNQLPSADRQELQSLLTQSSLLSSLQESIRSEGIFNQEMFANYRSGRRLDMSTMSAEEKETVLSIYGNSPTQAQKISEDYLKLTTTIGESLFWPDNRFQAWKSEFQQTTSIPTKESILAVYSSMRETMRQTIVSQSMAAVGLAVMDEGPAALARILDPLTGKLFAYRVVDESGSFELRSEVQNKGKPVTFTFERKPVN